MEQNRPSAPHPLRSSHNPASISNKNAPFLASKAGHAVTDCPRCDEAALNHPFFTLKNRFLWCQRTCRALRAQKTGAEWGCGWGNAVLWTHSSCTCTFAHITIIKTPVLIIKTAFAASFPPPDDNKCHCNYRETVNCLMTVCSFSLQCFPTASLVWNLIIWMFLLCLLQPHAFLKLLFL